MNKRLSAVLVILMVTLTSTFAQSDFINALQEIRDQWIRPAYPIIAGIIFIGGALLNMGHFFGENRDIKKGVGNILIYLAVALAIGGIYEAITAISLN